MRSVIEITLHTSSLRHGRFLSSLWSNFGKNLRGSGGNASPITHRISLKSGHICKHSGQGPDENTHFVSTESAVLSHISGLSGLT